MVLACYYTNLHLNRSHIRHTLYNLLHLLIFRIRNSSFSGNMGRGRFNQEQRSIRSSSSLSGVIEAGLPSSTNAKYHSAWKKWLDWCKTNTEVVSLPANPFFVALYLNYILQTQNTKGALISAFYGIRWGHNISGLKSPTEHPFVQLAFEGCQRLSLTGRRQPKEPISPSLLKFFYDRFSGSDLFDLRFLVLHMFHRFCRIS